MLTVMRTYIIEHVAQLISGEPDMAILDVSPPIAVFSCVSVKQLLPLCTLSFGFLHCSILSPFIITFCCVLSAISSMFTT